MYDLVVVGGGFWGVATAMVAKARGLDVLHLGDSRPGEASRASLGFFCERWYKLLWRQRVERARELAEKLGVKFLHYPMKMSGSMPFVNGGWETFDPWQFLELSPPMQASVVSVEPGVVHTEYRTYETRGIALATGVWTDTLLHASGMPLLGIKGVGGSCLVFDGETPESSLLCHHLNVFHQYVMRPWKPGQVIAGATVEKKPEKQAEYMDKMLAVVSPYATKYGWKVREATWGLRPVHEGPLVRSVAPGVTVLSGGGRIGAVLSFWAAEEALRTLGLG
jgi:glycine/D-amino acid oxidase-like deaminating enzyme